VRFAGKPPHPAAQSPRRRGVELIIGCEASEARATSIAIDTGFVATKSDIRFDEARRRAPV
jgi:hypothetical protein